MPEIWNDDSLEVSKLLADLSAVRYATEIAGIPYQDKLIATDRESRATMLGQYQAARDDLLPIPLFWKIGPGQSVTFDTFLEFQAVSRKVVNHVNNCFLAEGMVTNTINTLSHTERMNFDAAQAFHSTLEGIVTLNI